MNRGTDREADGSSWSRLVCLGGLCGALLWPSPLAAAEPQVPADFDGTAHPEPQLSYEAEPGCPDPNQFWALVKNKSRAPWSPQIREVSVRLGSSPGVQGITGQMVLQQEQRPPTTRVIQTETCQQAAEAMAIVVALALEAVVDQQRQSEQAAGQNGLAGVPPSPPPPLPEPVPNLRPLPEPVPSLQTSEPPETTPTPEMTARKSKPLDWRVAGGLNGIWDGTLPWPTLGGLAFVELQAGKGGFRGRLGAGYRASVGAEQAGVQFGTGLLHARLELCTPGLQFMARYELSPCAISELGQLRADARGGLQNTRSFQGLWGLSGGLLRFAAELNEVLSWELEGAVVVPWMQNFSLNSRTGSGSGERLYAPPKLGAMFGTGLKVQFP